MTLTRWFRQHQRYLIAGLVILLMASWGILSTVQSLVGGRANKYSMGGKSISAAEMQAEVKDAEQTLRMVLALRLTDYITPYAMESREAPLRATIKMQALAGDFAAFVFTGDKPAATYDAAWRYLVLLHEADAAGVQVTDGEILEMRTICRSSATRRLPAPTSTATIAHWQISDADMARWFPQLAKIAKLIVMQRQAILVNNAELWMQYVYANESVSIRYVAIDGAPFQPLVQPTDEELTKFYEAHRDALPGAGPNGIGYKAPERIRAEFALVPLEQAAKDVKVSDEEVAAYYKDNKEDYRIPDEAKPPRAPPRRSRRSPATSLSPT